jgi:AraC family transcriptional regulator of adaptative response / DNA-3-methyladenine glycosylase II
MSTAGVGPRVAGALVTLARAVSAGTLRLEPGADVPATLNALTVIPGITAHAAARIVMRALHWPDAFPAAGAAFRRAARVSNESALLRRAERWRPWRGYAAAHLAAASHR